jgi:menaquinol-cytochrome c reductase iron-sulfur subunit
MEMSDGKKNPEKDSLSRRQFLTYALGGTGAFMAAAIVSPMIPFAIDPLTRSSGSNFVEVGKVSDFDDQLPKKVEFKVKKKDGWVESEVSLTAWIIKDGQGQILAMSNICTHLGCGVNGTVDGNGKSVAPQDGKWFFLCPCHGSKFDKYGINSPESPARRPLDVYEVKVENGIVKLGTSLKQRKV